MKATTSQHRSNPQAIALGSHGEAYGNWMPVSMICIVGCLAALVAIAAALFFSVFHIDILGIICAIIALALLGALAWIIWIRWSYSTNGSDIMNKVHSEILSKLSFDGSGSLLDVGCGSGALAIRAAKLWPHAHITGIDSWSPIYNYSKTVCEENAASENVADRCTFQKADACNLPFPNETFDAVISNYVYHNINSTDQQALLQETLRVLKKGGVFALNDEMKPHMYGDMEAFAQSLRNNGYEDVRIIDTAETVFGSRRRAASMMLGSSRMIIGRK